MENRLRPPGKLAVSRTRIGRVPVLILRPAGKAPVNVGLLWLHGGGYALGMKEMVFLGRARELAEAFGVTVYAPGYRLSWQAPYPAAPEDCFSVLEAMARQGFDALLVGGESAGGGLAAAVCLMARDRGIPVAFQFPLYPMLSHLDTESSRDNHGRVWNTRRNHLGWRLYLRGAAEPISPYASPALASDLRGLPPFYSFVGDGEPFFRETLDYAAALRAAGVKAEVDVYHTDIHAFDMLRPRTLLAQLAAARFRERFARALEDIASQRSPRT